MSERGGGSAAPRPGSIYSSLTYWQKQMTPPSSAAPSHASSFGSKELAGSHRFFSVASRVFAPLQASQSSPGRVARLTWPGRPGRESRDITEPEQVI
jgi:hypothetical protein